MRFTPSFVLALMAMAAPVLGQVADFDFVTVPAQDQVLNTGAVLEIQWTFPEKYQGLTVKLILIGGPTQATQQRLGTIATSISNSAGSFSWTVNPMGHGQNYYGIIIESTEDSDLFQYSNPFHIKTGAASASSSSSVVAPPSSTTTVVLSSMTAAPSSAAASSAAQSDTLIVVDVTTTVPCETSAPTAGATSVAVVVPASSAAPAAESSPAGPAVEPSTVTPAVTGPTAASTGISGPSTFTSAVWTSPASPPAPTGGIPTTSGATRVAGSMAVVGGLIAAFLAL